MKIITFFIFILGLKFFIHPVFSNELIKLEGPVLYLNNQEVDIEQLRREIRSPENINRDVYDPNYNLKIHPLSDQIIEPLLKACGYEDNFEAFFESHGYRPYLLQDVEQVFLGQCLYRVYEFMDEHLTFSAPGFYRRLDPSYMQEVIDLGYRCGYRDQVSFTYFALSTWLVDYRDVSNRAGFRCLGDTNLAIYTPETQRLGVQIISNELLFYYKVFGNWMDVSRYIYHREMRYENRRLAICNELITDPFDDLKLNAMLIDRDRCWETISIKEWSE